MGVWLLSTSEAIVRFEYPSAKSFGTILDVLGNIVDEVLFNFTPEGLLIKALDPAKVALIIINIPSTAFLDYKVERELGVGVNLSSLVKSLPTMKKTDKLVFTANEEFYELVIEGITTKRYKFRSIEVSAEEVPEISLDFKVKAIVLATAFKSAIKDLKGVESIVFEAKDDQYLYLRGAEGGAEARLSRMAGSIIEMEVQEPSRNTYDEDYITKVLDLAGITENIEIKFGNEMPLNLYFTLVGGGSAEYLLAPKA
ncbi:MAG TPA: DNA polymerase sliding clamp [Acidilobales archaeon]|nr:DNA polymerase sliding clamp [Acidilobales archaeon]